MQPACCAHRSPVRDQQAGIETGEATPQHAHRSPVRDQQAMREVGWVYANIYALGMKLNSPKLCGNCRICEGEEGMVGSWWESVNRRQECLGHCTACQPLSFSVQGQRPKSCQTCRTTEDVVVHQVPAYLGRHICISTVK